MKWKCFALISMVGVITILSYLQWGREIKGCNTKITNSKEGYFEDITVISNRLFILDKESFAKQVVEKCADNSLKGVYFSYDPLGYPNGLYITVYSNIFDYRNHRAYFVISYSQDAEFNYRYNIKDNPEKFTLDIEIY